jgi:hypothetical protein
MVVGAVLEHQYEDMLDSILNAHDDARVIASVLRRIGCSSFYVGATLREPRASISSVCRTPRHT